MRREAGSHVSSRMAEISIKCSGIWANSSSRDFSSSSFSLKLSDDREGKKQGVGKSKG